MVTLTFPHSKIILWLNQPLYIIYDYRHALKGIHNLVLKAVNITVQQKTVFLLSIQVQLPPEKKELSGEIYHIDEQLAPNMFASINNIVVFFFLS